MSRTAVVRQVAALERGALAREQVGDLSMRLGVRPVSAPGRQRPIVQPEEVAAVRTCRPCQAARDGNACRLAGRREPLGLALALRLGHLQHDRPGSRHERGVVREHGIDEPVGRGRDHDLAAEPVEELAERLVLPLEEHRIGLAPAGGREVALRNRRRDEDAPERGGHRAHAIARARRGLCWTRR